MTAQQDFEQLIENEGKLAEFASLSEHGSLPQERAQIIETLIAGSGTDRVLVDRLLVEFKTMPEVYLPIIVHFKELKVQMLRREDGWKKILHNVANPPSRPGDLPRRGAGLTVASMNTVAWLCMRVDEPLSAIVNKLHGLAAASAVEAFLRWAVDGEESSSGSSEP